MISTALILQQSGFAFWDLGMHMPYKENLGAQLLPATVFIRLLRRFRDNRVASLPEDKILLA